MHVMFDKSFYTDKITYETQKALDPYTRMESFIKRSRNEEILSAMAGVVHAIALVFGPTCLVVLRSMDQGMPCIAVANGERNDVSIGLPAPEFILDAVEEEGKAREKQDIGIYYTRTKKEHTMKCVVHMVRNHEGDVIGTLSIGIDISAPLHEFIRSFIPVVDNNLAESISEPLSAGLTDIMALIHERVESAALALSNVAGLSSADRNRAIVCQLMKENIFSIRGAVNYVANELGVSRYTIYNYLKDINTAKE